MAILYGLVDAARDDRLYPWLASSPNSLCLFAGKPSPVLAAASPYIIELGDGPLAEAWRTEGRGQGWGIQCISRRSLSEMWRHFRHFLQAKLPDGRVVLFRFYDPRVWRVYFPTCDAAELAKWFDGVTEYLCEDADEKKISRYILRETRLDVREMYQG